MLNFCLVQVVVNYLAFSFWSPSVLSMKIKITFWKHVLYHVRLANLESIKKREFYSSCMISLPPVVFSRWLMGHTCEPIKVGAGRRLREILNDPCYVLLPVAACDAFSIMSILVPNLVTGCVCISTLFLPVWDCWEVISRNACFTQRFMWLQSQYNCTKEQLLSSFHISTSFL